MPCAQELQAAARPRPTHWCPHHGSSLRSGKTQPETPAGGRGSGREAGGSRVPEERRTGGFQRLCSPLPTQGPARALPQPGLWLSGVPAGGSWDCALKATRLQTGAHVKQWEQGPESWAGGWPCMGLCLQVSRRGSSWTPSQGPRGARTGTAPTSPHTARPRPRGAGSSGPLNYSGHQPVLQPRPAVGDAPQGPAATTCLFLHLPNWLRGVSPAVVPGGFKWLGEAPRVCVFLRSGPSP